MEERAETGMRLDLIWGGHLNLVSGLPQPIRGIFGGDISGTGV